MYAITTYHPAEVIVGLGVELRSEARDLRMVFDGMAQRGQPLR